MTRKIYTRTIQELDTRYTNHKASFNKRAKSNQTELSKHIWKLKDDGSPYTLTWTIKKRAQPYSPRTKRCNLCLWEKFFIITADKNTTLNTCTRTELTSTCRHKRNFYLSECGWSKAPHLICHWLAVYIYSELFLLAPLVRASRITVPVFYVLLMLCTVIQTIKIQLLKNHLRMKQPVQLNCWWTCFSIWLYIYIYNSNI